MNEKTLAPVFPEDETKETGGQESVPSHSDEESTDDIIDSDDDSESSEHRDDGGTRRFKNRDERREFFKNKNKADTKVVTDGPLSRSEFYKANENKGIRLATEAQAGDSNEIQSLKKDINDNWGEVVRFFNAKTDRSDPEVIEQAIYDAYAVWRRRNPATERSVDSDTQARKTLMQDQGVKGSSSKGQDAVKKTVLGRPNKGMDDWYPAQGN